MDQLYAQLNTCPQRGLSSVTASRRLLHPNIIAKYPKYMPWYLLLWAVLQQPVVVLLVMLGILYATVAIETSHKGVVFVAISLYVAIKLRLETKNYLALVKLQTEPPSTVLAVRDGQKRLVPSVDLVPGDIVKLGRGHLVPADGQVISSFGLFVNEPDFPASTQASKPMYKAPLMSNTEERKKSTLFAGSVVISGRGTMLVTATGKDTKKAAFLNMDGLYDFDANTTQTLTFLTYWLNRWKLFSLVIAAVVLMVVILNDFAWPNVVGTLICFYIVSIPHEIAALISGVFLYGSLLLAKEEGLHLKKIAAAEALGNVDTVVTDKTGSLTENRVEVKLCLLPILAHQDSAEGAVVMEWVDFVEFHASPAPVQQKQIDLDALIMAIALSTDPVNLSAETPIGLLTDTLDGAVRDFLLDLPFNKNQSVGKSEVELRELLNKFNGLEAQLTFDAQLKYSGMHRVALASGGTASDGVGGDDGGGVGGGEERRVGWKGAPEVILSFCTHVSVRYTLADNETLLLPLTLATRDRILSKVGKYCQMGARVLSYAYTPPLESASQANKMLEYSTARGMEEENDRRFPIIFAGVLVFSDPLKSELRKAVTQCLDAGVRIIMATGDHPETALFVAKDAGITNSHFKFDSYSASTQRYEDDRQIVHGSDIAENVHQATVDGLVSNYNIFARQSPQQRLRLMETLTALNHTPLLIADGFQDVKALSQAPVSISSLSNIPVTTTSSFLYGDAASIACFYQRKRFLQVPKAIKRGRHMRDNLLKAISFYICFKLFTLCNILTSVIFKGMFPLNALHIIILELFSLLCIQVLAQEPPEKDIMTDLRDSNGISFYETMVDDASSVFLKLKGGGTLGWEDSQWWRVVFLLTLALTLATMFGYLFTPPSNEYIPTMAFFSCLAVQATMSLGFRTRRTPLRLHGILSNRLMIAWLFLSFFLYALTGLSGLVREWLEITISYHWLWIGLSQLLFLAALELWKERRWRRWNELDGLSSSSIRD